MQWARPKECRWALRLGSLTAVRKAHRSDWRLVQVSVLLRADQKVKR